MPYAEQMPQVVDRYANLMESEPLIEPMRRVKEFAHQSVRDQFTGSKTPEGQSWPPRKRRGDGHPLLIDTGKLLQSATGGGEGRVNEVTPRQFKVGTRVEHAKFHQHGTKYIPRRPFMGMSEQRLQEAEESLADSLLEVIFGGE